ncbi:hypothetical protein ACKAMS_26650 [Rhodococcus sp. 5A-K4]|uniref:hypothetical protein n=1 Tax=Rhodococcus sp. 5A-K4 TaxID=3384442 RepID=UPI002AA5D2F1
MATKGMWLAVDIIGTAYGKDVFIHSAGGERVASTLPRCAGQLGLGKKGEMVVEAVVRSLLAGKEVPKVDGLIVESHQIDASDGTPVALIVWIGENEPEPRPTYNVWVLDMSAMTTRTSGDDPSMIGDGREAGEERHVQYLFTWLNPEDAWGMVGGYYDALTGEDGMLIQSYWSLRPDGAEFVHMWSSCRLRLTDDGNQRTLYGLTLRLQERELEANIASLVKYSNATLMLVEARNRIPLTTVGKHAPLRESQVAQVLDQIDLEQLASHNDPDSGAQKVLIDGEPYTAATFELHSARAREKHGDPVAIILLLEDSATSA